ncbi:UDP-glucuronosyltransferase 2A2-like isoform X2 [Colossoma macropomum]|uniref:UDP-glucuronosyltransferase 2A2-like isoform X2 n=1 Tax=Colossoma macropomum TaxID=42526 RepID=UPI0018650B69|nr:UDP-glucuronosyltransferase 2A2-like isoform X2 [Colossoma macropomum]
MIYRHLLPLVALILSGSEMTLSGNILVVPGYYSHWYNMRVIVDELVARNHSVTVLVSSATPSFNYTQKENFKYIVFKVSLEKEDFETMWENLINFSMSKTFDMVQVFSLFWNMMSEIDKHGVSACEEMLLNQELIASLRESHFDVLLFDPVTPGADLLAEILDLPRVMSFRLHFAYSMERLCGQLPTPPSYVPAAATQGHLTDHMNFIERVENVLLYVAVTAIYKVSMMFTFDKYYTKIRGKPTTMCDTWGNVDIWLIRTYWDFEYPRPLLPNFKFVGGLHCKPAKPLPKEMEEFVQSSGDDGIVVFSLGSIVKKIPKERANTIASALGQIPQKVLWRYMGEKPDTLAPNTRLYDWIPQNDLLGTKRAS